MPGRETTHPPRATSRVLIIGLDGATFRVLSPLVRLGYLPHLERLLRRSAYGTLRSTEPYITGPAWLSLVTGKRPDTHGVFDWSTPIPGTYRRRFVDARDRTDLALWDILHREGEPAGILNVPLTYPPSAHTSFCVTGLLTPAHATDRSHPTELWGILEAMGYVEDVVPSHYRGETHVFLDALVRATRARGRAIRYCLAHFPWRAALMVFTGPDRIQHVGWHHLELVPPTSDLAQGAIAYYQVLDEEIGRILLEIPEDSHVYLVSDHGFGPHKRTFYINEWLEAHGYLRRRRETRAGMWVRRSVRAARRRTLWHRPISDLLRKVSTLHAPIDRLFDLADRVTGDVLGPIEPRVNWARTVAFAPTPHGVQINLQHREPEGIVPPEDYDRLRQELKERLEAVRDPVTGDRIHAEVLFREVMYTGRRVDGAPDLTYRFLKPDTTWRIGTRAGRAPGAACVSRDLGPETGTHTPDGILMAAGPDIQPGRLPAPVPIWDVLPTLLYHLGLPIPRDLDGRVVKSLIRPEVLARRSIAMGPAAVPHVAEDGGPPGTREDPSVRRRLEDLGYLS